MIYKQIGPFIFLKVDEDLISVLYTARVFSSTSRDHPIRYAIGSEVIFLEKTVAEPYSLLLEGRDICTIGAYSFSRSAIPSYIKVGRYCSIGPYLHIPGHRHPVEALTTSNVAYDRPWSIHAFALSDFAIENMEFVPNPQKSAPIIGNDVWIGSHVILSDGITIGDGACIAAGSVVTKNVAPYTIVGGNPARVIRYRFSEKIIENLMKISWWNYGMHQLKDFPLRSPELFIAKFKDSADLEPWNPIPFSPWDFVKNGTLSAKAS